MPFIQTAFLGNEDEDILHFGAVRFRITGNGNLGLVLVNLGSQFPVNYSSADTYILKPLIMNGTTGIEPTVLCNFNTQRASLIIGTDKINETFKINRILVYTKPIYKSYPQ